MSHFENMAHPRPDPTLPADDWRRDFALVAGAMAVLLLIASVAQLLSPGGAG